MKVLVCTKSECRDADEIVCGQAKKYIKRYKHFQADPNNIQGSFLECLKTFRIKKDKFFLFLPPSIILLDNINESALQNLSDIALQYDIDYIRIGSMGEKHGKLISNDIWLDNNSKMLDSPYLITKSSLEKVITRKKSANIRFWRSLEVSGFKGAYVKRSIQPVIYYSMKKLDENSEKIVENLISEYNISRTKSFGGCCQ